MLRITVFVSIPSAKRGFAPFMAMWGIRLRGFRAGKAATTAISTPTRMIRSTTTKTIWNLAENAARREEVAGQCAHNAMQIIRMRSFEYDDRAGEGPDIGRSGESN